MAEGSGRHAGARRAPKQKKPTRFPLVPLGFAVALTASVVAWGYLVWVAIDFGATAREGNTSAWWLLGLATLGAVACLFVGLLLAARLIQALGATSGTPAESSTPRRPTGGRRALR